MKKILTIIVSLIILTGCNPNLTEGLIAYYPFNGNLKDSSGNNNHGFSEDISFTTNNKNKDSSAVKFNRDEIKINSRIIETGPFTISFWVYIDSYNDKNQYVITNGGATRLSQGFSFLITGNRYLRSHGYDKNRILFIVSDKKSQMRSGLISPVIPEKEWVHITGMWNGESAEGLQLFINGKDVKCEKYSSELKFGPKSNLKMGRPITTTDYSLYGKLDEVRIYKRILTKREIKKIGKHR